MRAIYFLAVTLIAFATRTSAQTTQPQQPDAVAKYVDSLVSKWQGEQENKRQEIANLQETLKAAKRGRIDANQGVSRKEHDDGRITFLNLKYKAKHSAWATERIEKLKRSLEIKPSVDFLSVFSAAGPIKTGDAGHFRDDSVNVFQVIDKQNVIVKWWWDPNRTTSYARKVPLESQLLWIAGFSTQGMTDGLAGKVPFVFEASGTKTYQAATGTNTIVVLKTLFETSRLPAELPTANEPAKKAPTKVTSPAFRTWADATGKFTVRARFGGIIGGKVLLIKEDGSKVFVTTEQLGEADRKYLGEITSKTDR